MASKVAPKFKDYIPSKHELIEAVLEFVTKELEGRPEEANLDPSDPATSVPLPGSEFTCVSQLLQHEPDHVYRFSPKNLSRHVPGRPSFKKLIDDWEEAGKESKEDGSSFPEVRKKKATNSFMQCVLSCMCEACSEGEATELLCKPRMFGHGEDAQDEVLVHEFPYRGKTSAVILGTGDSPDEYRLWGAYKDNTCVARYNEFIRLKEIHKSETTGRQRQRKASAVVSRDEDFPRPQRRQTASGKKREPASSSIGRKNGDTDDEEDVPLMKLLPAWNKSTPQSARSADPKRSLDSTKSPLTKRTDVSLEGAQVHDLEHAYQTVLTYIREQPGGDRIIITNNTVLRHLLSIQEAAQHGDKVGFQAMKRSLDRQLIELGLSALPDM